jgi:hypothetical protein
MVRVLRVGEVLHVTPGAIAGRARVLVVHMTLRASGGGVRSRQCELGLQVVIEFCALPLDGGMAESAV